MRGTTSSASESSVARTGERLETGILRFVRKSV
jgi:hypothetical protein